MELAALLKPAPFAVKETRDPEQLLHDFKDYMKTFKKFLIATKVVGAYMVWGKEITTLFEHVGRERHQEGGGGYHGPD